MTTDKDARLFIRNATWCAVAIAALLLSAKIFAAPVANSETVKIGDLNVNNPAGVAALYHRIHSAAQRMCEIPGGSDLGLEMRSLERQCIAKAEEGAVQQLNIDALSAYYATKTGRARPMVALNKDK